MRLPALTCAAAAPQELNSQVNVLRDAVSTLQHLVGASKADAPDAPASAKSTLASAAARTKPPAARSGSLGTRPMTLHPRATLNGRDDANCFQQS